MSYLRHASRQVHQTMIDYLSERLTDLGWMNPSASTPFGAGPITITDARPFIGTSLNKKIAPGTVAITLGNEINPDLQELGGPLSAQDYPVFCDVFMPTEATALALACDIRDAFLGRNGGRTALPVFDYAAQVAVSDWKIYLTDVERIAPEHTFPLSWQSVRVTAETYFQEVLY